MLKSSIVVKAVVLAVVAALAMSSLALAKSLPKKAPKAAAAAPAAAVMLQSSWKEEQLVLRIDSFVLVRIDRFLDRVGQFSKRPADRYAGRLGLTIRGVQTLIARAQALVSAHAGFDASGTVTDAATAQKTVSQLSQILNLLRGSFVYRLEHMKL